MKTKIKKLNMARLSQPASDKKKRSRFADRSTAHARNIFHAMALCLMLTTGSLIGQTFSVSSYGALGDGVHDDGPAIRAAITAAVGYGSGATVSLPAGTYLVSPDGTTGYAFNINNSTALTIQGAGPGATKLIITNPLIGGFQWQNSSSSTIRDISVDYNPLPFTQGTIVAINTSAGTFDLTLHSGYPSLAESRFSDSSLANWGMVIDPSSRKPKAGTDPDIYLASINLVGGSTYRLALKSQSAGVINQISIGDRFVYLARNNRSHIMFFKWCTDTLVESVTTHASPATTIAVVSGSNLQVSDLSVCFPQGSDRLITTDADGLHVQQTRVGPVIDNCYFEGMADDGMNIYCNPNLVRVVNSSTSIDVNQTTTILPGDRLQIYEPTTGVILGETTASSVTSVSGVYRLTLSSAISGMVAGTNYDDSTFVYNLSASGEGYMVTNNIFNPHRGRSILAKAGHGMIANNVINGSSYSGIIICNEKGEGPLAADVLVLNNSVSNTNYANTTYSGGAIQINPYIRTPALRAPNSYLLRDITLSENVVSSWPNNSAIYATSVSNLEIQGGQITNTATANSLNCRGMRFAFGSGILVEGVTIVDPRPNLVAGIHLESTIAAGTAGFSATDNTYDLATGVSPIRDDRIPVPTGLSATAFSSLQINLSWTPSSGATGYNVKRATIGGGPYTTIATGVAGTTYGDSGLSSSTVYYYVVSAVLNDGESANSPQVSAATPSNLPITFVSAGSVASGTNGISPALPAGLLGGDILLMFVETANQVASVSSANGGTWTQVAGSTGAGSAGAAGSTRLTVLWSRYNGTQGAPTLADSGDHTIARIVAVRNAVLTGNPWNVFANGAETIVDTSGSIPGATTTVADTFVVVAAAGGLPDSDGSANFSGWTNANLANLQERTDDSRSDGFGGSLGISTGEMSAAGSIGSTSVTFADATAKAVFCIAIRK